MEAVRKGGGDSAAVYAQSACLAGAEASRALGQRLSELLEEPERAGVQKRRRLWRKTGPPAPICHERIEGWLPCMLAAALPRLSGALVKDHRGLSVLPHPHRMEQKILTNGQCHLSISGIVYHTKRACDNCDRPIEDIMWFACAEGCEVDFCARCHTMLQQLFEGRDLDRCFWAESFTLNCAKGAMRAPAEQRQAFIEILAFDWPLQMFQDLVRAVADVADAKVVHLQDGADMDVAEDADFWHLVGFLQLLRCANQRPAKETRFGELTPRGPRVPETEFVLGGIDKCDAQAEWERWKKYKDRQIKPERIVVEEEFQVDGAFALFLVHGDLVPLSFRQRCLDSDLEDLQMKVKRPLLTCQVPRSPARTLRLRPASVGESDRRSTLGGALPAGEGSRFGRGAGVLSTDHGGLHDGQKRATLGGGSGAVGL